MIGGAKGIGIGIDFGIPNQYCRATNKPYIEKDVLDSLRVVASAYGKSNDDADRSIVKNLVDASNPFIISNAAYKLNSGYGKYEEDFTTWVGAAISINNGAGFKIERNNTGWWGFYTYGVKATNEFKIKVTNCRDAFSWRYKDAEGIWQTMNITKDGIYTLPASQERDEHDAPRFFNDNPNATYNGLTVEQIPSYQGAFVTDGIDDLITSTKTVQEMLGGSNKITVVSMIHQIELNSTHSKGFTNYIETIDSSTSYVRTQSNVAGKTGIYGYTYNNATQLLINNILGDKNDYEKSSANATNILSNSRFSVAGGINNTNTSSSVAWYWTIIANKVLTTDQINQVIAYFNLDRTLKPDILCNISKQGITNDNHAEFNDKLIDYSGNGRDIQMNNLAWKGGSGIAAKPFETIKDYTIVSDEARQKLTIYNEFSYKVKSNTPNHYWTVQSIIKDNTSYQVTIITDKDCYWINSTAFTNNEGNKESIRKEYPVKANTPTQVTICGLNEFEYPEDIEPTTAVSYVNLNYAGEVTVTFIPSCKGGLLLDGVNDFGKVTGLPIYKDYTVIADYERLKINIGVNSDSPILSKAESVNLGAFMFNTIAINGDKVSYSFGCRNIINADDTIRKIFYQSKYINDGQDIDIVSTFVDSDKLWLGTYRDSDYRFIAAAIYSLMSFPYSMSEFLIERQLKKHKLGTLYPNMVEFRPVIKANANYKITYYQIDSTNTWKSIKVGDYIVIGAKLAFQITFDNDASELKEVVSPQLSGIIVQKIPSNSGYNIYSYITSKSPQKINITIYQPPEYLTMLSNSTLISNETLIKNE